MHALNRSTPSVTGIAAMLGAGLAEIGEVAEVGVAIDSTGTVPACGEDDEEEGPGGAPPTMFCRGERGLCPAEKIATFAYDFKPVRNFMQLMLKTS